MSRSEVSRICAELDPVVDGFRTRPLTTDYPYLWVDATYHKVRVNGRVTSQATVSRGRRQERGRAASPGHRRGAVRESGLLDGLLRSVVKRGRRGVRLITSNAQESLKQAIATVLSGATWQRCRVHFMRNLLATVPRGARKAPTCSESPFVIISS